MNSLEDKIAAHSIQAEESWGPAYGKIAKVIKQKNLKRGAEVGVAFAGHAESILKGSDVELLYGIDPYKHFRGYDDPMNLPQKEFDVLYKFILERMSKYGKRYKHIRSLSEPAITSIKEPLDFVYIDADHSYEGVWRDLINWFPKIQDGGIISGHDYGHVNFPGVKQAIDEFFQRFGWEIHEEGEGVWWVEKRHIPVSYIMPAYNAEKTINASIDSIMKGNAQPGDELVVVNDCSTDSTAKILKNLQKKYKSLKIVEHPFNKGGGAARNTAIENAENELIFCLDSDNILTKGSVIKLKDFMCTNGADVASFETLRYFKSRPSQTTHTWKFLDKSTTLAGALSHVKFPGASGNYLFTKSSWIKAGRYPEGVGALDAWGLGFRQVATGAKMKIMPNSYYNHRYGHDSYWVRDAREGKISLLALQLILPFVELFDESDINYIFSPEGRYIWFDNIEAHPIKLKSSPQPGLPAADISHTTLSSRILRKLKRLLNL